WLRWSSGCSIRLPSGRSISQPVGNCYRNRNYVSFVDRGYFSAVILLFGDKGQFDGPLTRALSRSPRYRRAAQVVYGRQLADIWVRHPQPRHGESLARLPHTTPLQAILIPEARPSAVLQPVVVAVIAVGLLVAIFTLLVRVGWRRRKASGEL
ncbi:MAG: hypothetical protein ACREN4_05245, partial [Candidatus Dormibacteria bacterium]